MHGCTVIQLHESGTDGASDPIIDFDRRADVSMHFFIGPDRARTEDRHHLELDTLCRVLVEIHLICLVTVSVR
jgi:hypothetical protein